MMREPQMSRVGGEGEKLGCCAVCGLSDRRGLVEVRLTGGERVTLCGSHELMHRRSGASARDVVALRAAFGDRRRDDRRAFHGEVDELAQQLTSAFTRERRGDDRRTG